jgi:hypothetical protein
MQLRENIMYFKLLLKDLRLATEARMCVFIAQDLETNFLSFPLLLNLSPLHI